MKIFKSKKKKYLQLLKEFYPRILAEAESFYQIGPPDSSHKCSDCPGCECCFYDIKCQDCESYNWAVNFFERLDKGEFNDFSSHR